MLICFNGTWLTNDGTQDERAISSGCDVSLNGKLFVEEADFTRALAATFFARGNKSNTLQFKVSRNMQLLVGGGNPVAQAAAFSLTHFTGLPTQGDVQITCGAFGETPIIVVGAGAILEAMPQGEFNGVSVDVTYSIRVGSFVTNASLGSVTYDGGVEPQIYTDPLNVLDGGNAADTFINNPVLDGGVLV